MPTQIGCLQLYAIYLHEYSHKFLNQANGESYLSDQATTFLSSLVSSKTPTYAGAAPSLCLSKTQINGPILSFFFFTNSQSARLLAQSLLKRPTTTPTNLTASCIINLYYTQKGGQDSTRIKEI